MELRFVNKDRTLIPRNVRSQGCDVPQPQNLLADHCKLLIYCTASNQYLYPNLSHVPNVGYAVILSHIFSLNPLLIISHELSSHYAFSDSKDGRHGRTFPK
jgi:hypothetical protein